MGKRGAPGFTIIELLVTLAVLAVLLAVGAPQFSKMTKDNRLQTESFALRGAISAARSKAQTLRQPVTLCRSTDGVNCSTGSWGGGYITFVDADGDGQVDDAGTADSEQVIQVRAMETVGVDIQFSQGNDRVLFDMYGNATASTGTFTFCDDRGSSDARGMILSAVGSLSNSVDDGAGDDSADIPDDHLGADLSCPGEAS